MYLPPSSIFFANSHCSFSIITEFGRSLVTKCGSTLSLVKTVKPSGLGRPVVLIHVGANQFIREAYLPEHWKHRLLALDAGGMSDLGFLVAFCFCICTSFVSI